MKRTKKELLESIEKKVVKSLLVAKNTLYIEYLDGCKAIRLHDTDIITQKSNGNIVLNSGGFKTPTTKERLNRRSYPININCPGIYQKNYQWFVGENSVFYNGITFNENGDQVSPQKNR